MHTGNYRGFQNAAAGFKDQRVDLPAEAGAMGSVEERAVLSEIGRALGKHAGSIAGMLAINGGIAPPGRSRSVRVLSSSEREEISRGLSAGLTLTQIAGLIGRSVSTISREVNRNGGRSFYRANLADQRA